MVHPLGDWAQRARANRYNKKNPRELKAILECLAPLELEGGDRFVDFGCGQGFHLLEAAKRVQQAIAVDGSPSQLAHARRVLRGRANVQFLLSDFLQVRLAGGWISKGFSRRALHHLDDRGKHAFLAGISPAFGPGGLFLLEDVIRFPGWQAALADFQAGRGDPALQVPLCLQADIGEAFPAQLGTLAAAFAGGGFRILSCQQLSPFYGRILAQHVG